MDSGSFRTPEALLVLEALESSEASRATSILSRLGAGNTDLAALGSAFRRLLHRRGYFVSTPDELAASLQEIRTIGEGFDLFELARSLSRLDAQRSKGGRRRLPELKAF